MAEVVFLSDLDGTLLHSRRKRQTWDYCVEWIDGQGRGFMNPKTAALLQEMGGYAELIPVSARSIEQYKRIMWPSANAPKWAFVDNGATLLMRDDEGEQLPISLPEADVESYSVALKDATVALGLLEGVTKTRIVDGSYAIGIASSEPPTTTVVDDLGRRYGLNGFVDGKKIYLLPPNLKKSIAIKRMRELQPEALIIAAGDTTNDLSMLRKADIALAPAGVEPCGFEGFASICPSGCNFECFVADEMAALLRAMKTSTKDK